MQPTDFELDILRCLNGEDVPGLVGGAAMSVAIEYLAGAGLAANLAGTYVITEAGRAALKAREA